MIHTGHKQVAEEILETLRRRRDGRDGRDAVLKAFDQTSTQLEDLYQGLARRVAQVEGLIQPDNDMVAVPAGVAQLVDRMETLEKLGDHLIREFESIRDRPMPISTTIEVPNIGMAAKQGILDMREVMQRHAQQLDALRDLPEIVARLDAQLDAFFSTIERAKLERQT